MAVIVRGIFFGIFVLTLFLDSDANVSSGKY